MSDRAEELRRYLISGRVQGVGFRWFTRRTARKLGLAGWVRNLADGRVEAVAKGAGSQLAEFEAALTRGPAAARVSDLQTEPASTPLSEDDFIIRR